MTGFDQAIRAARQAAACARILLARRSHHHLSEFGKGVGGRPQAGGIDPIVVGK
jgi:hypothetical protein